MKRILISHSWTKPETHSEITQLLERHGYEFIDRSVLPSEPLSAQNETHLKRQLSNRISQVSTVLVAATDDAHRKPLVQYEIEESVRQGKRLVAVQPLGSAGNPVPKTVDDYADAIVGFRSEHIVAAIEGENIRNHSSYEIAEKDDVHRTAHAIARCASGAVIIGVLTHQQWVPKARALLEDKGYVVYQHTPPQPMEQVVESMLIWGFIGLFVGAVIGGRWVATTAFASAAIAGAYAVTSGISIQRRDNDRFSIVDDRAFPTVILFKPTTRSEKQSSFIGFDGGKRFPQ